MVGYSRLMQEDEAGTLERLKVARDNVLAPLIAAHHGRVVKHMGDGVLVEFASVVDAVNCALACQMAMARHEQDRDEARRLTYRMGINLGDVMIDDGDIFGDGVNLAARLEPLAEPGGICVSAVVYDQVRAKGDFAFRDLGLQDLKNIAQPLRVYALSGEEAPAAQGADSPSLRGDSWGKAPRSRFCPSRTWAATWSRNTSSTASPRTLSPLYRAIAG